MLATRDWWARYRKHYRLVTSEYVLNELSAAPSRKAAAALELIKDLPLLSSSPRLQRIVAEYIRSKVMPAGAVGDAAHLAMASVHSIDFVLTWNCKHLANANKIRHIGMVNQRLGLSVPVLTTPLTLIEDDQ